MKLPEDGTHYVPIASLALSLEGEDLACVRAAVAPSLVSVYACGNDGQIPPVLVRGERVVDGHHRILAAIAAGRTHVYTTRSLLRAFGPALP